MVPPFWVFPGWHFAHSDKNGPVGLVNVVNGSVGTVTSQHHTGHRGGPAIVTSCNRRHLVYDCKMHTLKQNFILNKGKHFNNKHQKIIWRWKQKSSILDQCTLANSGLIVFYVTHNHMCLCVFRPIYFMSCILYCDVSGRLVLSLLINWLIDWLIETDWRLHVMLNTYSTIANLASIY